MVHNEFPCPPRAAMPTERGENLELEYKRVGDAEYITASCTPKEMAALVLELQGRRGKITPETIRDILLEQSELPSTRQKTAPHSDLQQHQPFDF